MGTNHKPRIDGVDHGIWRRVKLLPFEATFVKTDEEAKQPGCVKRTEGLSEAIDTEIEGILAWAVDGCLAWQNEGGLKDPEAVRAATEEYRSEMDRLSDFLSECVERKPAVTVHENGKEKTHHSRIPARDLYEAYIAYCYRNAEKAVTLSSFGKMMRERGFEVVKSNGKKYDGVAMTKTGEEFLQVYHAMHNADRRDTVSG
jgi:putative DNA primase/helicase